MLNEKFWEKYFKAYDLLNAAIPYQELLDDLVGSLDVSSGDKILDAGSGTGNLSLRLKEKGADVYSMDYSEQGVNLHMKKDSDAKAQVYDLTKTLPFEDSFFDKIVSNNVVYTIEKGKRKEMFDEFNRVLKSGGKIVVGDVHKGFKPLFIFIDHIKKSLKDEGFLHTLKESIRYFFVILKLFYYNYHIKKENKKGDYDFLDKGEHQKLLSDSNFSVIEKTKNSYSNQSYIDVGRK